MNLGQMLARWALEGRTTFQGLQVSIENKAGSTRSGVASDGTKWSVKMPCDYGYIKRTEGIDGDHVDCFLGSSPEADTVWVVHIKDPKTGKYDEDKCFLGFDSEKQVRSTFKKAYDRPSTFWMGVDQMPFARFKEKVLATKDRPTKIAAQSRLETEVELYEAK